MLQIWGTSVNTLGKLRAVLETHTKFYLGGWGGLKEVLRSYILQIQIQTGLFHFGTV